MGEEIYSTKPPRVPVHCLYAAVRGAASRAGLRTPYVSRARANSEISSALRREVAALEEDEVDAGAERVDVADARVSVAERALELRQLILFADDGER